MRHIIVTRFGLGIRHPTTLRRSLVQLKHTLLPSLRRQTCQDFRWVITTDPNSPEWFYEELRILLDGFRPASIIPQDPFRLSMAPDTPALCMHEFGTVREILMSRVDHDDMIHPEFVALLQGSISEEIARSQAKVIVPSAPTGINVWPDTGAVRISNRAGLGAMSIGTSVYLDRVRRRHIYNTNHGYFEAKFASEGTVVSFPLPSSDPLWAYFIYSTSDSHAGQNVQAPQPGLDAERRRLMRVFSLSTKGLADFARELAQIAVEPLPKIPDDYTKYALKMHLVRIHSLLRSIAEDVDIEKDRRDLERDMQALKQAVYYV